MPLRSFPVIAVAAAAAVLAGGIPGVSAEVLLEDDFSQPLRRNWILFGDPLPIVCDSMGQPAPSFDNNGDPMYDSGAISRGSWDYSEGLVLECDMYVTSNERGAWISGELGLVVAETAVYGQDGMDIIDMNLTYDYCGEANWSCPHLQGQLQAALVLPDMTLDSREYIHFNDCLDSWHRYRIVIEQDMTVSFYVDTMLIHRTTARIPEGRGEMSVVLGNRSSSWGRVFHDNLVLMRPD